MAPLTLSEVHSPRDGKVFPRAILDGCETALVLFAGAFYGRQDAYWVAEAGLRATCVDIRSMDDMAKLYPPDWEFVENNVYEFARWERRRWDVVTVDCPSGHFARCGSMMAVWCDLASKYVVLGAGNSDPVQTPKGWQHLESRRRSDFAGGTYWQVYES